ncbi:MAG TPA: GAF domain-containing protein [Sphingomicrobium sp.]|jgi:GAF domain-containing protein
MSFATGLQQALRLRQSDVVSELRHGDSLEQVLDRHLLTVERMSDSEIRTSVLLLSPDGKHLTHGAAPSLPQVYREAIDGLEIGPSAGSCGTAAFTGQPVYVTDIATDPRWAPYRDLALPHGLLACWSTPIRNADGEVLGTFAIYHRSLGGPTRDELNTIEIITDNVAKAITWARNPGEGVISDVLPRQVAALEALAAAIWQQGSGLDSEGQDAIDAIMKGSRKLSEVVRRQLTEVN